MTLTSFTRNTLFGFGAETGLATPPALTEDLFKARAIAAQHPVPEQFHEVSAHQITVDKVPAILLRHEPAGRRTGFGGEHISFVIAKEGTLKGFTRMTLDYGVADQIPDQVIAKSIAQTFLTKYAPDLLPRMEILWVERHDETISVPTAADRKQLVTGTKVKARDGATGLYFWVIVGAGGDVVTFERDIRWIDFPGCRGTEQWLHDAWLRANSDKRILLG